MTVAGTVNVQKTKGSITDNKINFTQINVGGQNLAMAWPKGKKQISQKSLTVLGSGSLDWGNWNMDMPKLNVAGDFGAATLSDLKVRGLNTDKLTVVAQVATKAELAVLQSSFGDFIGMDRSTAYAGTQTLDMNVQTGADYKIRAEGTARIVNLKVKSTGDLPEISEPVVDLACKVLYDPKARRLDMETVKITSGMITLDAIGALTDCGNTWTAEKISGNLDYDVEKVRILLGAWLPKDMKLTGRERGPFTLNGALAGANWKTIMKKISFTSGYGFEQLAFHGFVVQTVSSAVIARDGIVDFGKISTKVNNGQATASAYVDFTGPTPILRKTADNILVEKVELNELMSQTTLRYVNPIFGPGRVKGLMTVTCSRLEVPLDENAARNANVQARVQIDDLDMETTGLIADIFEVIGGKPLRIQGKIEPFDMTITNGRVYYKDLKVRVGVIDLAFSGSVSLIDDTVDLQVSLPLTEKLLSLLGPVKGDVAKLLVGQRVSLPITGTIGNTKLSTGQLLNNVQDLIQGTLKKLLPF